MATKFGVCQSCGMPFGGEVERGTELDGRESDDYCIDCYKDGNFVEPDLTLEMMVEKVTNQMRIEGFPEKMITVNTNKMAKFKRWR
jgi:hypothetical protein